MSYVEVSIIMPTFNCSQYVEESICSVLSQSYENYELLIVDDCSTDGTIEILKKFSDNKKIRLSFLSENGGPAIARNTAIKLAEGRFVAFLDSDDIWGVNKLEKQISEMKNKNHAISYTDYDLIDEHSNVIGSSGGLVNKINYYGLLKRCIMQNSTVVYDSHLLGGKVYCPILRKRQDFGLFLSALKKTSFAYKIDQPVGEAFCFYRIRSGSVSSNKMKNIPLQWKMYFRVEGLGFFKSCYYMVNWLLYGFCKTVHRKINKILLRPRL